MMYQKTVAVQKGFTPEICRLGAIYTWELTYSSKTNHNHILITMSLIMKSLSPNLVLPAQPAQSPAFGPLLSGDKNTSATQ